MEQKINFNFASQRTFYFKYMVTQDDHLKDLKEIRSIMERSSRFISLSGLSGILAGVVALISALTVFLYKPDFFWGRYYNSGIYFKGELLGGTELKQFITFILITGSITLLLAIGFGVIFTYRNARKKGLSVWDKSSKRMLANIFIPLIAGGLFCLALLYHKQIYLLAPATLIFYGLALINVSKYTFDELRYLGICEVVLGLLASVIIGYGLIFWAIGFGVLHIIYGSLMYYRYERFDSKS